jgi:hypothetical protein
MSKELTIPEVINVPFYIPKMSVHNLNQVFFLNKVIVDYYKIEQKRTEKNRFSF